MDKQALLARIKEIEARENDFLASFKEFKSEAKKRGLTLVKVRSNKSNTLYHAILHGHIVGGSRVDHKNHTEHHKIYKNPEAVVLAHDKICEVNALGL